MKPSLNTIHLLPYIPNPPLHPHRSRPRRPSQTIPAKVDDHAFALSVTLTLTLLIAIGLPLAAILPQKYIDPLPINILVPLYSYPDPGAWDLLYDSFIKHSELNFTIIVNPSHGPGTPPYPGALHVAAIKKLNVYPNVVTVGYIDTKQLSRPNATVRSEIETYASWSNETGLGVHGIFFDQTPYADSMDARYYLRNISAEVKHSEGILEPKLVIHNPGRVPNANLTDAHVDITIVYEGAHSGRPGHEKMMESLAGRLGRRENYGVLVNSVPKGRPRIRKVINDARKNVGYMFVTSLREKVYDGLGSLLEDFLDLTW